MVFIGLSLTILCLANIGTVIGDEYCQFDNFHADCHLNAVVVMTQARYGRMRVGGRCVHKDMGYVGCGEDVLTDVDRFCSGRHKCQFGVPELGAGLAGRVICDQELSRYLEADYMCQPVDEVSRQRCHSGTSEITEEPTVGYISSVKSSSTGCGSTSAPWIVEVSKGQRINITLYDFNLPQWNNFLSGRSCEVSYGTIKESSSLETLTICGEQSRTSFVLLTKTNRAELRLFLGKNNSRNFFLKYEAVGCPDLVLDSRHNIERAGDVSVIKCKSSGSWWQLTCNKNKWEGKPGNCTHNPSTAISNGALAFLPFTFEVSMVLILVISLTIGLLVVIVGVVCIRRGRQASETRRRQYEEAELRKHYQVYERSQYGTGSMYEPGSKTSNEYACILDFPLPTPPINSSCDSAEIPTNKRPPARPPQTCVHGAIKFETPRIIPADHRRHFEIDPRTVSG